MLSNVSGWFHRSVVETGRLPLFCFFAGMLVAFGFIRLSVRMIRAGVSWWPGNVTPGGLHVHHVVFGVVFMLVGGVAGLVVPANLTGWRAAMAVLFGIGSALVLDEFALILHLRDVYWSAQGRTSIDAIFVAIACTGLLLIGLRPFVVEAFLENLDNPEATTPWLSGALVLAVDLVLATVTLLKGKIWTGLLGLFVPLLLFVGALRLARPESPWARWRYRADRRHGTHKLARAQHRELRFRRPVVRAKIWLQSTISGTPR
jgi:hypothetical protein